MPVRTNEVNSFRFFPFLRISQYFVNTFPCRSCIFYVRVEKHLIVTLFTQSNKGCYLISIYFIFRPDWFKDNLFFTQLLCRLFLSLSYSLPFSSFFFSILCIVPLIDFVTLCYVLLINVESSPWFFNPVQGIFYHMPLLRSNEIWFNRGSKGDFSLSITDIVDLIISSLILIFRRKNVGTE